MGGPACSTTAETHMPSHAQTALYIQQNTLQLFGNGLLTMFIPFFNVITSKTFSTTTIIITNNRDGLTKKSMKLQNITWGQKEVIER